MAEPMRTYAPESAYKKTEDFIKPTQGSGVEVAVAWNERVIGDYHFHGLGDITIGSDPTCDIQLPIGNNFVKKMSLIHIGQGISVHIPMGAPVDLLNVDESGKLAKQRVSSLGASVYLQQKEMLHIHLSESLKLIIRPSQASVNPKVVPLVDISSDGFLSLALAVAISAVIALLVQLNPTTPSEPLAEEIYPTALFLQSPQRVAKILKLPPPKVDFRKPEPTKPQIKNIKTTTSLAKTKSSLVKAPGNKTQSSGLTKNTNNSKSKVGSKFNKGKSVKVSQTQGSQANRPNLNKSGIFKTFGTAGGSQALNTDYSGEGILAGLAKNATNSAGQSQDRGGDRFGDRFKQAQSSRHGESNVGVEGLQGRNGLGPGVGEQSLGDRKTVAIVPSGQGAVFNGEIDREGIRKVFFDNARALRSCYERALNKTSTLGGKLMLDFDIGPGGRVTGRATIRQSMSTFYSASMANCITNRLRGWRFPPPPRNNVVNVLYPLAFSNK